MLLSSPEPTITPSFCNDCSTAFNAGKFCLLLPQIGGSVPLFWLPWSFTKPIVMGLILHVVDCCFGSWPFRFSCSSSSLPCGHMIHFCVGSVLFEGRFPSHEPCLAAPLVVNNLPQALGRGAPSSHSRFSAETTSLFRVQTTQRGRTCSHVLFSCCTPTQALVAQAPTSVC